MEMLALVRHQQTEIQEMKGMFIGFASQLRDLVPAYVTLIDATERGHHILPDQCRSHEVCVCDEICPGNEPSEVTISAISPDTSRRPLSVHGGRTACSGAVHRQKTV